MVKKSSKRNMSKAKKMIPPDPEQSGPMRRPEQNQDGTYSPNMHYAALLKLAAARVLDLVEARLASFEAYSKFMDRMAIVMANQQACLKSKTINQNTEIALSHADGAWKLAAELSSNAKILLSRLLQRSKDFVSLFREAESVIGKSSAFLILHNMDRDARAEAGWYLERWREFLYFVKMFGILHSFGVEAGSPVAEHNAAAGMFAWFDEASKTWAMESKGDFKLAK